MQRRPNVFDVGPKLYKCYANILFLLGHWVDVGDRYITRLSITRARFDPDPDRLNRRRVDQLLA